MPSATSVTMTLTRAQPQTISAGPPTFMPKPKRVSAPDRIEMIVNDTAKLEKVFIPLRSSCAYPSEWSFSVSLEATLVTLLIADQRNKDAWTPDAKARDKGVRLSSPQGAPSTALDSLRSERYADPGQCQDAGRQEQRNGRDATWAIDWPAR